MHSSTRCGRVIAFVCTLAFLSGPVLARQAPSKPTDPIAIAKEAFTRGDFAAARTALDALASKDPADAEILLLRAQALIAQREFPAALSDVDRALATSSGPARTKLEFVRARVLIELGRLDDALATTRSAVDRLREPGRRQELVKPWIDAAKARLEPDPKATELERAAFKPDYATAKDLLEAGKSTGALGALATEVDLLILRCLDAGAADARARLSAARTFLKDHAEGSDASPAIRAEVLFILGRAELAMKDVAAARATARTLTKIEPPDEKGKFGKVLWLLIATTDLAVPEIFDSSHRIREAIAALVAIDPSGLEAEIARQTLASSFATIPELRGEAVAVLDVARAARPNSENAATIELAIDDLLVANGDVNAAVDRLEKFLAGRPLDDAGRDVLRRIEKNLEAEAERLFQVAGRTPEGAERTEALEAARAAYVRLMQRFPARDDLAKDLFAVAEIEGKLEHIDAALLGYAEIEKRFPTRPEVALSRLAALRILADVKHDYAGCLARIDRLMASPPVDSEIIALREDILRQVLEVKAKRVFRKGETPLVEIESRNVDKVTVALYRVNLKDFFLATGSIDIVGDLDVSLIKPDREFALVTKGATGDAHAPSKLEVKLDDPKDVLAPGEAIIVAARSGSLDARTLAMCSDLSLAVVRTGTELRSLAVDRASGEIVADAVLRIADDHHLLPVGAPLTRDTTGPRLEMLVAAQSGLATVRTTVTPDAMPKTAMKGFLVVDRTMARPGDTVTYTGFVRDAEGAPRAEPAIVRVVEVDRAEIARFSIAPEPGGRIHGTFRVDPAWPGPHVLRFDLLPGERIGESPLASDNLEIEPLGAEPAITSIEPTADHLFQGEPALFFVRRRETDGRPRENEEVWYRVGNEEPRSGRTDALGRLPIEVTAEETTDRTILSLAAGTAADVVNFDEPLHTHAANGIEVSGDPPAEILAGDSLALGLRLVDELGEGVAGRIDWTLLRVRPIGDQKVGSGSVTLGADGRGKLAIAIAMEGEHQVRLEWKDAGGLSHRQTVSTLARAMHESDGMRILPPGADPLPGSTIPLRVLWPFESERALIAVFGTKLERANLVKLERGVNTIEVALPKDDIDRVSIELRALERDEFASTTIGFASALNVALDLPQRTTNPGALIDATIHTSHGGAGEPAALFVLLDEESRATDFASQLMRNAMKLRERALPQVPLVTATSGGLDVPSVVEAIDPLIAEALAQIERAASDPSAAVMVDRLRVQDLVKEGRTGGGAGGPSSQSGAGHAFGAGGRVARKQQAVLRTFVPGPLLVQTDLATDAAGNAKLSISPPETPGRYALVVLALGKDGSLAIDTKRFTHDPSLEARLSAISPSAAPSGSGKPKAHVRVGRRDRGNGAVTLSVVAQDLAGTPPLVLQSLEVPPLLAAEIDLEFSPPSALAPRGYVLGVGDSLTRLFPPSESLPTNSDFAIRYGAPLVLDDAARGEVGSRPLTFFASPIGALFHYEPDLLDTAFDSAAWRLYATSQAVILAKGRKAGAFDAATITKFEEARDVALAHLLASFAVTDPSLRNEGYLARLPLYVLALAVAKTSGVDPEHLGNFDSSVVILETSLATTPAPKRRALPLYALTLAGASSFERLNRLVRDADQLSARELALLVLTLRAEERDGDVAPIVARLVAALGKNDALVSLTPAGEALGTEREVAALIALAIAKDDANARALAARALETTPQGEAGGAIPLALVSLAANVDTSTLMLRRGNFERAIPFASEGALGVATIDLASLGLPAGAVSFEAKNADGTPGLVVARMPAPPRAQPEAADVAFLRSFHRSSAVRKGESSAIGTAALGGAFAGDEGRISKLGLDRTYHVTLRLSFAKPSAIENGTTWIFEPDLPSLEMVRGSLQGAVDVVVTPTGRWLRIDGISPDSPARGVMYDVIARAPGSFESGIVLQKSAVAGPYFVVKGDREKYEITADEADADVPATFDERLTFGVSAEKAGRHDDAIAWLKPLLDAQLDRGTNDPALFSVLRTMLHASLALGKDGEIVRLFEIAKERIPDDVLGFPQMDRVAKAYATIKETERAQQVLAAIADSLFLQEARVTGRLESLGNEKESVAIVQRLLAEYDASPTVIETTIALGQHAYSKAIDPKTPEPRATRDPSSRVLDREEWLEVGSRALEDCAVKAPAAESMDEVVLTLANLRLEQKRFESAIALSRSAQSRFKTPAFKATWPYVMAFASFAQRDLEGVIANSQAIVDAAAQKDAVPATIALGPFGNHMLAQAWHAKGDLAKARGYYQLVKDKFEDAQLVLAQLDRTAFTSPLIVFAGSGDRVVVPLDRRGTQGAIETSVYPIDLRLLYLKRRGFDSLSTVELSGVAPLKRLSVEPVHNPAADYPERLELESPGVGAYLVVMRSGDLATRTLAVVSDITIEVTPKAGGARVNVYDRATHAPKPDALVTFVGSNGGSFVTAKSDLRGIAAASGLEGRLAVIAQLGGHYAFHQSEDDLPATPESNAANEAARKDAQQELGMEIENQAADQLLELRQRREETYKSNTNRVQQGVEVKRTKR